MENQETTNLGNAEKLSECKYELEKFKITLDFLRFEATTLWQIFSAYFVAHTIIIGFISSAFVKNKAEDINIVLLLIAGIVGLLLAILWLGTFRGNSKWYYYRMENQAKKSEEEFVNSIKDDKWFLLNKDAELFAKKNSFISNKAAGYSMITVFIIIYLIIIFWSFCKLNCNC
ncbi:MAG TPA: hypothetical protein PLW77_10385 [Bacteroidales bacterium]|nr:hypothetical protein [Bacteroidales bacterium]